MCVVPVWWMVSHYVPKDYDKLNGLFTSSRATFPPSTQKILVPVNILFQYNIWLKEDDLLLDSPVLPRLKDKWDGASVLFLTSLLQIYSIYTSISKINHTYLNTHTETHIYVFIGNYIQISSLISQNVVLKLLFSYILPLVCNTFCNFK